MMRYDRSISVVHSPENNCYFYQEEDPDETNHPTTTNDEQKKISYNFRLPSNNDDDYYNHNNPSDDDEDEEDIDTVIIDTKRYPKPYVYVAGLHHSIPIDCELWKSMARGRCCHGGDVNYERAIHKIFREENKRFRDDASWAASTGNYSRNNRHYRNTNSTAQGNKNNVTQQQRSIHSRSTYYDEKYEDRRRKLGQHDSEEDDDSYAVPNSRQQKQHQSPNRGLAKPQMIARSQQKQPPLRRQQHRPSHVSVSSNDAVTPEISYPEEWTVCSNSIRTSPDMPSSTTNTTSTAAMMRLNSNPSSFQIPQHPSHLPTQPSKNTSSKLDSYREQAIERRQQQLPSSSHRKNLIMSKKPWIARNERIPTPPTTTSRDHEEEEDDDDDDEQLSPIRRKQSRKQTTKQQQRRRQRRRSRPSRNGLYSVLKKLARQIFGSS